MSLPNTAQLSPFSPFDGLLLVDKPSGLTSHDVVARIRRHFKFEKVGHGGTLDPSATGLLVLLIGRATKLSDRVMGADKTYEGRISLGTSTSTYDAEGEVTASGDCSEVTEEQLREAMLSLTGDIYQTPPMVSAVKKDGVPLYKLARKGKTVERPPRLVHVYEFRLLDFGLPESGIRVRCTKGTYVRSLCHDVGEALGCHAHLASLRRTGSGNFTLDDATTLEEILSLDRDAFKPKLVPMLTALRQL